MVDALNTALEFFALKFTQNKIYHFMDPADPEVEDRNTLRYYLQIKTPVAPQSPTMQVLTRAESREIPPVPPFLTSDGARFLINSEQHGLLDGLLAAQIPAYDQAGISVIPTLTSPYQLIEEIQGGTPAVEHSVTLPEAWLYKGGLSEDDFPSWGDSFFDVYLKQYRSFLTHQPAVKVICQNQREYLYFLINFAPLPSEVRLRIEVTYNNSVLEWTSTHKAIGNLIKNQVLCVPVGLKTLSVPEGMSQDEFLASVKSYRVWLSDHENHRLSEVRTFLIDRKYRKQTRHIIFSNSFNTFDMLRLVGEGQSTLKTKKTTAQVEGFYNSDEFEFSELKVISNTGSRELTVSTGYFERDSKQYLKYLDELLLSKQMYLVTDKGYQPLILMTTDLNDSLDQKALVARSFTFQIAKEVFNFSDLPEAPDSLQRPVGWKPMDTIYLLRADGKRSGYVKGSTLQKIYLDDFTDVKPIKRKPNVEGDPDYIAPIFDEEQEGYSPFLSVEYTKIGSYVRALCPGSEVPGRATIVIAAGAYGGETQSDANALAVAAANALDTQAYANTNGVCIAGPWVYDPGPISAGFANFRISDANSGINFVSQYNLSGSAQIGNGWFLPTADPALHMYPVGTWDIRLPIDYAPGRQWRFGIYPRSGSLPTTRVRIYVNALQVYEESFATSLGYKAIFVNDSLITSLGKVYIMISYS